MFYYCLLLIFPIVVIQLISGDFIELTTNSDVVSVRPELSEPIKLPDTTKINSQLNINLQCDHFFSLWMVFQNEHVKLTGN